MELTEKVMDIARASELAANGMVTVRIKEIQAVGAQIAGLEAGGKPQGCPKGPGMPYKAADVAALEGAAMSSKLMLQRLATHRCAQLQ